MVKVRKTLKRRKTVKRKQLKRTMRSRRNNKKIKGGNHNTTIIMMWMIGCVHCTTLKPIWDNLKAELKDVMTFTEVESANIKSFLETNKISSPIGYPTLVKIKNGVEYIKPESIGMDIDSLRTWMKS